MLAVAIGEVTTGKLPTSLLGLDANTSGATAELTFNGTQVDLLHKQGPDCGVARVVVDGQPAREIDTYGPAVNWNAQVRLAERLPPGRHVVRIEVTGARNEKSSNRYVQLVGFDVR